MFKIEPVTSLAMSVHANPGGYALLIGSGVSRGASIPTGWEITLDLIKRLAAARGEEAGDDPAAWFRRTYNADPDYSDLLNNLYDQGSRHAKLREYFEPVADERDEGRKMPTAAHKAIARLVRDGFVRVIITTNFDHLLEDAIRNEGLEPVLVSTADAVEGATPIIHAKCFILKVHGDYLDVRIKNTKAELESYDGRVNRLLDQILDGFGLIVCGWSADWDPALRAAIERCSNRRYGMFWVAKKEPNPIARKLIQVRDGKFVQVESADSFFDEIAEKIAAIAEATTPNPAEIQVAISLLKRYLAEDRYRIRLHDFLLAEAREAQSRLAEIEKSVPARKAPELENDAQLRECACEKLFQMLAVAGFHARGEQIELLRACAETIATDLYPPQGGRPLHPLLPYPSVLAVYIVSLTALAAGHYATIATMLDARAKIFAGIQGKVIALLQARGIQFVELAQPKAPNGLLTPGSEFLYKRCNRFVANYFKSQEDFDLAFDRFEYIESLVRWEERDRDATSYYRYRDGRWMWKASWSGSRDCVDIRQVIENEITQCGSEWPPLRVGLFGGSLDRLKKCKEKFDTELKDMIERMRHGF